MEYGTRRTTGWRFRLGLIGWLVAALPAVAQPLLGGEFTTNRPGGTPRTKIHDRGAVIRSLVGDARGVLWIGTWGSGIWRWEGSCFRPVPNADGAWPTLRVSRLLDSTAGMLAATAGEGLLVYSPADRQWKPFHPDPGRGFRVLHALCQHGSRLAIGSVGSGTALFDGSTWRVHSPGPDLLLGWVNDLVPWKNGILAGGAEGWQWFDPAGLPKDLAPPSALGPDLNITVFWASGPTLLAGTADAGAWTWDGSTWRKIPGTAGEIHAIITMGNTFLAGGAHLYRWSGAPLAATAQEVHGPWSRANPIRSLIHHPTLGVLIGTQSGWIHHLAGDSPAREWARFQDGRPERLEKED